MQAELLHIQLWHLNCFPGSVKEEKSHFNSLGVSSIVMLLVLEISRVGCHCPSPLTSSIQLQQVQAHIILCVTYMHETVGGWGGEQHLLGQRLQHLTK